MLGEAYARRDFNRNELRRHWIGSLFSRLHGLVKMIRTTRNWYSILISALLKWQCVARFRGGNSFLITRDQLPNYFAIRDMVFDNLTRRGPKIRLTMHDCLGQVLEVNACKFIIAPKFDAAAIPVFFKLLYDQKLAGYEVIDIGAYTGDSAICFASKGARVYAYEPVAEAFAMLSKNVALNGMQDVIATFNCAVGQEGRTTIYLDTGRSYASSSYRRTNKEVEVDSVTIEDAIKKCHPDTRKLLKVNCEGCEFAIVSAKNAPVLAKFHKIICFYHSYLTRIPRDVLLEALQLAGFRAIAIGDQRGGLIVAQRS